LDIYPSAPSRHSLTAKSRDRTPSTGPRRIRVVEATAGENAEMSGGQRVCFRLPIDDSGRGQRCRM
jgi:hypothetical protein